MEVLLNSDIAKLVLGYLGEQNLQDVYYQFCENSVHLENECQLLRKGYKPIILGNLTDILSEYYEIKAIINHSYEKFCNSSSDYDDYKVERNLHSKLQCILLNSLDNKNQRKTKKRKFNSSVDERGANISSTDTTLNCKKFKSQMIVLRNTTNSECADEQNSDVYVDVELESNIDDNNKLEGIKDTECFKIFSKSMLDNFEYPEKLANIINTRIRDKNDIHDENKQTSTPLNSDLFDVTQEQNNENEETVIKQNIDQFNIIENNKLANKTSTPKDSSPKECSKNLDKVDTKITTTPIQKSTFINCKNKIKIISDEPYVGNLPSILKNSAQNISSKNSRENLSNETSFQIVNHVNIPVSATPIYDIQGRRLIAPQTNESNPQLNQPIIQEISVETEDIDITVNKELTVNSNILKPAHSYIENTEVSNVLSNKDDLKQPQVNSSTQNESNINAVIKTTTPLHSNIISKQSKSTPRRDSSHIRVLDFTTPKNDMENIGKWLNTKTPRTIERSINLHLSKVNINNSESNTLIQNSNHPSSYDETEEHNNSIVPKLEGDWNRVQGFGTIITNENVKTTDNINLISPKINKNQCTKNLSLNKQNSDEVKENVKDKEILKLRVVKTLPPSPLEQWNQLRSVKTKDWDQYIRTIVQEKTVIELNEKKTLPKFNNTKSKIKDAPTKKLTKLIAKNKDRKIKVKTKKGKTKKLKSNNDSTLTESNNDDSILTEDDIPNEDDISPENDPSCVDQKFRVCASKKNEVILSKNGKKFKTPNKINEEENLLVIDVPSGLIINQGESVNIIFPKDSEEISTNSDNEYKVIECSPEIADQNILLVNKSEFSDILPSFFETPYKYDLSGFPITPRFMHTSVIETPTTQAVNSLKIYDSFVKTYDIMTPSFPITPGSIQTPKIDSGGHYSNRPTDYSSSSSYYRPDESGDYNGKYVVGGKSPVDSIQISMQDIFGPDTPQKIQENGIVQEVKTTEKSSFEEENKNVNQNRKLKPNEEKRIDLIQTLSSNIENNDKITHSTNTPSDDKEDRNPIKKNELAEKTQNNEVEKEKDEHEIELPIDRSAKEIDIIKQNQTKIPNDIEKKIEKEMKIEQRRNNEMEEEKIQIIHPETLEQIDELRNKSISQSSSSSGSMDTLPSDNDLNRSTQEQEKLQRDLENKRLRMVETIKESEKALSKKIPKQKAFLEAYKLKEVTKQVVVTGSGSALNLSSVTKRKSTTPKKLVSFPSSALNSDSENFSKLRVSDEDDEIKDYYREGISGNSSSPINLHVESDDSHTTFCDLNATQILKLKHFDEKDTKESKSKSLKRVLWKDEERKIAINILNESQDNIEKIVDKPIEKPKNNLKGIDINNKKGEFTDSSDDDENGDDYYDDDYDSMNECAIETYDEKDEKHFIKINAINKTFENLNTNIQRVDFSDVVMNVFLANRKVKLTISDSINLYESKSTIKKPSPIRCVQLNKKEKIIINPTSIIEEKKILNVKESSKKNTKYSTSSSSTTSTSSKSSLNDKHHDKHKSEVVMDRNIRNNKFSSLPRKRNLNIEKNTSPKRLVRSIPRQPSGKIEKIKLGGSTINALLSYVHGTEKKKK